MHMQECGRHHLPSRILQSALVLNDPRCKGQVESLCRDSGIFRAHIQMRRGNAVLVPK